MTAQDLLNMMEMLDQELQLQSGENDVTRGLIALNAAQDYLDSLVALVPKMRAFNPPATLNIYALVSYPFEYFAYPPTLQRLDRIHLLKGDQTSEVDYELDNLGYTGSHITNDSTLTNPVTSVSGKPTAYWTDGYYIYFSPKVDQSYWIRLYGFTGGSDFATAATTLTYPDYVALPLATFAAKLMQTGVGDPTIDYQALAQELFQPALLAMQRFNPDRNPGYDYRYIHET